MTSDQRQVLEALLFDPDVYEFALAGARGTVKTFAACALVCAYMMTNPGELGIVLRKTTKSAVTNIRDQFFAVADLFKCPITYNQSKAEFRFPNGSEFHIRHCASDADYRLYQGIQYALIWFEEATQHSEVAYTMMGGSRRARRAGVKAIRIATANPGEMGDAWYMTRFVNDETREPGVCYVQASLFDSLPTLERNPGYYDEELSKLPEWKQEQWVLGKWGVKPGTYFEIPPDMLLDVQIPPYAKFYAACDWGYWPDTFAVVWFAKWQTAEGRDRVHVLGEYGGFKMDPDVQARNALRHEEKLFDQGYMTSTARRRFADPTAWKRQEKESTELGRTIASMWQKSGWIVQKALTNARVPGWQQMRTLLSHRILTISPRCVRLIDDLQNAVHEGAPEGVVKGEDIDERCGMHYGDSLRYGLVSTFPLDYKPQYEDPYVQKLRVPIAKRIAAARRKRRRGAH